MSNTKDTAGGKSKPEGGMSDSELDQVSGGVRGPGMPGSNPFPTPRPRPAPQPIIYPNKPGVLK